MQTRRSLLLGAGALAALPPRALAQAPPPCLAPRPSPALLPTPDFAALAAGARFVAHLRPHRAGGVRLESEAAMTPRGLQFTVHNYGHGGAGITLSFGCASVAADLVASILVQMRAARVAPSVAVIGSGVIGLTSARELRRRFKALPISLYDRTLDVTQCVSHVAGGQFEPSQVWHEYTTPGGKAVLADYLRRSHARLVEIDLSGTAAAYGIARRKNYTLDDPNEGFDTFTPCDVVPKFTRAPLPFQRLNVVGRVYDTWLVDPTILLPKLIADLAPSRIARVRKRFDTMADVRALRQNIVVNCTGLGARELCGDAAMQAHRGLLAVLKNPAKLDYFFSGGCGLPHDFIAYMFARQNDIVIGGTVAGDGTTAITAHDRAVGKVLIANAARIFDGKGSECVDPREVV